MPLTPNLNLDKPIVGADADMWGEKLNFDLDILDMKVLDQTLLAAGVVTFLRTPNSMNLRAVVTDETGTGPLVFGTSPTLTDPVVTGGSINNTPIGVTTRAAGSFTTVAATNDALINDLTVGRGAGNQVTNTTVGQTALNSNTNGVDNTAVGLNSLRDNTSGSSNTGVGRNALRINTTGNQNVAIGHLALSSNTTGSSNTASGVTALLNNTIGAQNTAVGFTALRDNTSGNFNSAFGLEALIFNTTGESNQGLGYQALRNNTTGNNNAAFGLRGLGQNTTGVTNTTVGNESLGQNTTGSNNFAIGFASGNDALRTITTQNNEGVLGNNSTTAIFAKVAITVTSDIRDKTEIREVPHGLDLVKAITPIAYQFKTSRDDATPTGRVHYGFSAQDILALQADQAVVDSSDPENLKLNAQDLIPVLWNAVRELQAEIQTLKGK